MFRRVHNSEQLTRSSNHLLQLSDINDNSPSKIHNNYKDAILDDCNEYEHSDNKNDDYLIGLAGNSSTPDDPPNAIDSLSAAADDNTFRSAIAATFRVCRPYGLSGA